MITVTKNNQLTKIAHLKSFVHAGVVGIVLQAGRRKASDNPKPPMARKTDKNVGFILSQFQFAD